MFLLISNHDSENLKKKRPDTKTSIQPKKIFTLK